MTIERTRDSRDALSRARFFLEKSKLCSIDNTVDFEAFLEASIIFARAALHRLQSKYEGAAQWQEWWQGLLKCSAVNFFRNERNYILKEGPPKLGQNIFLDAAGIETPSSPAFASKLYFYGDDPNIPATKTVETHLDSLEEIINDGENRFNIHSD